MRKLKLQMQLSLDGFVAGPKGEMDWMTWNMDDGISEFINTIIDTSDTILLGRKMTDGFVSHWENVIKNQPESPDFAFAKKMVDTPKVVFTKTLKTSKWANTQLATGSFVDEIEKLKQKPGKDILVYGGGDFVSSLINEALIDEFHLFINPVIIGTGISIFKNLKDYQKLHLLSAKGYACGITVLHYQIEK